MKRTLLLLCSGLVATLLPGCLTVTSELALPEGGGPGILSTQIRSFWTWPLTQPAAPALPSDPVVVLGKNPVLPAP
jgi:hypothetical protein